VVAPNPQEYLVTHGSAGEFGRFQALLPLECRRGDRVVLHSHWGLEIGVVLCPATPRHARLLPTAPVGQLLRIATAADEQTAEQMRQRSQCLFEDGSRLAGQLGLPLQVLDVDLSLDGRKGIIHFVGEANCGLDSFAATLAGRHNLFLLMHNLALAMPEEEAGGCGEPNCGRGHGGCTSCGTAGGCATGCGTGKADMKDYFAHLRAKMERRNMTPLL
jgi:hypothetical protein